MGTSSADSGIGCTKLQTFPYGPFGSCDVYERITIVTTYLRCAVCTDNALVEPLCKSDSDICDSPTPRGVQVTVNGDDQQCALSGFINNCIDYT